MRTYTAIAMDIYNMDRLITEADLKEAECVTPGVNLKEELWAWKDSGNPMRAAYANGKLLLLGGWSSHGLVWMLSTVHAADHPVATLRAVLECKNMALKDCPRLFNKVMLTNKAHVALLESIGAELVGPITPTGGEPFQAFYIE